MRKSVKFIFFGSVICLIFVLLSMCIGSVRYNVYEIFKALLRYKEYDESLRYIVIHMRLPRTLGAILTGACLSLGGMIYQCILRNPMADSYVLGISSAASCSLSLAVLLGICSVSSPTVSLFAFVGSSVLSLTLAGTFKDRETLLLIGIASNFFLSALSTLFIYMGKDRMNTVIFWQMGSLASLDWLKLTIIAAVLFLSAIPVIKNSQVMDIMLLDDGTAISCGLDIKKTRITLLIISSALTSTVISFCGIIGFVGLVAPHAVKLVLGDGHKKTIVPIILTGSSLMLMSDIVSRTVLKPSELPVGIVTSLIGAPVFLLMLRQNRKISNA